MSKWIALSAAIWLAFGMSSAATADDDYALIYQSGNGNSATVDQTGADNANYLLRPGVAGSLAQIDHNTVTQIGNNNTADVKEAGNGASNITAQVYQHGDRNSATINSTGTNNWSYIRQTGNDNIAGILQNGTTNGGGPYIIQGYLTAHTDHNQANITQTNFNTEKPGTICLEGLCGWYYTNIAQDGGYNIANIQQSDSFSTSADIGQNGFGNAAYITQSNLSNSIATIEQAGDDNYGSSTQYGDAESHIMQHGNNNSATTYQSGGGGNPNNALITQNGNFNTAGISQFGGGNHATIRQ